MIILTAAQADKVRGLTIKGHALAPKPFVRSGASNPALNGMFGLPEAVLSDPVHAKFAALLKTLPTIKDSAIKSGTTIGPGPGGSVTGSDWDISGGAAMAAFSSSWPAGDTVSIDLLAANASPVFTPAQ